MKHSVVTEAGAALVDTDGGIPPQPAIHARYSDRPAGWLARLGGMGGTAAVYALILSLALFSWRIVRPATALSPPVLIDLQPLAARPEPVQEVPEGKRQVEQEKHKPVEKKVLPPPVVIFKAPAVVMQAETALPQAQAAQEVPQTTAPRSLPAPPAAQASSDAQRTWEALLLAHLERYRRYPATAKLRREQGVTYVRFRMNRTGQILSASIARSSGSRRLDQAAIDTIHRAQPLPAIPNEKPDEVDLSVPVAFFVS